MSDVGDLYKEIAKHKRDKREHNRLHSTKMLLDAGIKFTLHNNDAHLIIDNGSKIDFWPSTGLWIDRSTQEKQRGIAPLLKYLEKQDV